MNKHYVYDDELPDYEPTPDDRRFRFYVWCVLSVLIALFWAGMGLLVYHAYKALTQ